MTSIEAIADVDEQHHLTANVPDSVPPGKHRVVVLVDQPRDSSVMGAVNQALTWDNGLLVYTGELQSDPEEFRRQLLRDRHMQVSSGAPA